jgi:tetratricopeptide (TPR) repeat protein
MDILPIIALAALIGLFILFPVLSEPAELCYRIGRRLFLRGMAKSGKRFLDSALRLNSNHVNALVQRGILFLELGKLQEGTNDLTWAAELNPLNPFILLQLADAWHAAGDMEKALRYYNEVLELETDAVAPLYGRAVVLFHMDEFERSLLDLDRMLVLAPDHGEGTYLRGLVLWNLGRPDDAGPNFERAAMLIPENPNVYLDKGVIRLDKGDFEGALTDLTTAVKLDPENAWGYYHRSRVSYEMGLLDFAEADLNKSLELQPGEAYSHYGRGRVRAARADWEGAAADYTEALKSNPKQTDLYVDRGWAFVGIGQYDSALSDFQAAVDADPENAAGYEGLAHVLSTSPEQDLRDGVKAVEMAEKAVDLDPSYRNLKTLAETYAEAGNIDAAVRMMKIMEAMGEGADDDG